MSTTDTDDAAATDPSADQHADHPTTDINGAPVIMAVSEEALGTVLEVRATEDDPEATALRVAVTGSNMTDFQYALDLVLIAEAEDGDAVYTQGDHGELTVIIPADSITQMTRATLDVPGSGTNGGLVIRNPNTPDPLAGLDLDLSGELPEKVQAVLDQAINPALGAHGGYATLVGVDGNKVIITMGGGCQGCAASAMTLREGITKMLMDALPEIEEIIDATDHTAGENPFYT